MISVYVFSPIYELYEEALVDGEDAVVEDDIAALLEVAQILNQNIWIL